MTVICYVILSVSTNDENPLSTTGQEECRDGTGWETTQGQLAQKLSKLFEAQTVTADDW